MAGRKKVLLVEDDLLYAGYLIDVMGEAAPSLEVFHVNGGLAALSVMKNGYKPDLIMSDIRMPRMTGIELLAKVKDDPQFASIPFLILSGVLDEMDKGSVNSGLADGCLLKPGNYPDTLALVERIKALCGEDRADPVTGSTASTI